MTSEPHDYVFIENKAEFNVIKMTHSKLFEVSIAAWCATPVSSMTDG